MRLENNKWKMVKLGDCCQFFNGKAHEKQIDNNGNYIVVNSRFISSSGAIYKKTKEALFPLFKNDIVMVMSDVPKGKALAKCYLIEEDNKYSLNQRICAIRSDKVEARFLYYHLNRHPYLLNFDNGENQTNLRKEDILKCPLYIPPIEEQKRIVEILDKAFEGIAQAEANTRRNLINAREIFDSYLASIHSDREKLRNLVDIRTGKLNSNAAEENGIYPFFTCSRDVYRINDYAFDCEAILLAGNNASGDFNVKHYSGKFNAYQRTYVITINPEKRIAYRYLYYQLLHSLKEFKQKSVGAATKFLKIGIIQDMEIPLPNIYEQNKIVVNLDSLQTKTQKLETIYQRKLEAIAELKQSILEKAFTGQLSQ